MPKTDVTYDALPRSRVVLTRGSGFDALPRATTTPQRQQNS